MMPLCLPATGTGSDTRSLSDYHRDCLSVSATTTLPWAAWATFKFEILSSTPTPSLCQPVSRIIRLDSESVGYW